MIITALCTFFGFQSGMVMMDIIEHNYYLIFKRHFSHNFKYGFVIGTTFMGFLYGYTDVDLCTNLYRLITYMGSSNRIV